MNSKEFKNYTRLRNGVETVPSNIRKNYHLEKIPRGKQRGKFFFGSKIAALNFRKLFNYVKGLGHYAQNPVLVSNQGREYQRLSEEIRYYTTKYEFFKVL